MIFEIIIHQILYNIIMKFINKQKPLEYYILYSFI